MAFSKSNVSDPGRGKSLSGFEYCHQNSETTGDVPAASELRQGEIAINTADGKLFFKNAGLVKSLPSGFSGTLTVYDNSIDEIRVLAFENGILVSAEAP